MLVGSFSALPNSTSAMCLVFALVRHCFVYFAPIPAPKAARLIAPAHAFSPATSNRITEPSTNLSST